MAGLVYLFTSGTSWTVPAGVTGIQVECYGPGASIFNSGTPITSLNSGGSYSKSNTVSVTPGSTVYFNIGSSGGNTWFNTSNVAPTSSSSTSSACLAVGSSTASGSQIAANCGDVKYKGGDGYNSPVPSGGWGATGQGGQAGPNGNGADAGPAYYVASNGTIGSGGGANSGSQAAYNTIPYGRGGSGSSQGRGGYATSVSVTNAVIAAVNPTQDIVGAANFSNGTGSYLATNYNYGPRGGTFGYGYRVCCNCTYVTYYQLYNYQTGFIVITLVTQTTKYIVVQADAGTYNSYQTGSFTLPSDFGSLTSIEAFGAPGKGNSFGGAGGGGYSKTLGSSITASLVAGSTTIYYQVAGSATSVSTSCGDTCSYSAGPVYPTWMRIGTNSAPTSVTNGVLANGGQGWINNDNTSKAGATTTGAIGDTKYGGGAGGACTSTITYAYGGGGGGGGPSGNGANAGNGVIVNGGGGGGASNGGNAGSDGTSTNGGAGGSITGGTGGSGATTSTASTAGTNGGGGGGGYYGASTKSPSAGGVLTLAANVYGLIGGGGGGYGGDYGGRNGGGGYSYTTSDGSLGGMIVFTYTTGAAPTVVALTGRSATASAGTLTPVPSFTQALSGRSATASAGTLTPVPSFTQALSGASASASTGIFGTSNAQTVNLSSTSITAYSGTLTNSQIVIQALTGVSASGQTSSFPANSDLVGVVASAGTGALNYINTGWQPIDTGGTAIWTDIDTQQI